MKKLLLASSALAALTATASAADLPRRMAPPPVFTPVPVFTWTGFYLGFNAGYGFGVQDDRGPTVLNVGRSTGLFQNAAGTRATDGALAFANRSNNDGFVGGGQIGYNYQLTPGNGIVIGIEADAQYAGFGRNRNSYASQGGTLGGLTPAGGVVPGTLIFNPNGLSSLDYFGTVRGRLGYAFDRALFYGTGGFAYGGGGGSDFGLPNGSSDDFRTGWVAGAGVEYALPTDSFLNFFKSSAVTFKVEGLYVNLDSKDRFTGAFAQNTTGRVVNVADPDVTVTSGGNRRNQDTEFAVVRAGINYKFGSY